MKYPVMIVSGVMAVTVLAFASSMRGGPNEPTKSSPIEKGLKRNSQIVHLQNLMKKRFDNVNDGRFGMSRMPGFHESYLRVSKNKTVASVLPRASKDELALYKQVAKEFGDLCIAGVGRSDTSIQGLSKFMDSPSPRVVMAEGGWRMSAVVRTANSDKQFKEWSKLASAGKTKKSPPESMFELSEIGKDLRDAGNLALKQGTPIHLEKDGIHFDADLIFATEKACYTCHKGVKEGEAIGSVVFAYGKLNKYKSDRSQILGL